jgi:hypothetical protein
MGDTSNVPPKELALAQESLTLAGVYVCVSTLGMRVCTYVYVCMCIYYVVHNFPKPSYLVQYCTEALKHTWHA